MNTLNNNEEDTNTQDTIDPAETLDTSHPSTEKSLAIENNDSETITDQELIAVLHPFEHVIDDASFNGKLQQIKFYNRYTPEVKPVAIQKKRPTFLIILLAILIGTTSGIGIKLTDYYLLNRPEEARIKYEPSFQQFNQADSNTSNLLTVSEIAVMLEPSVVAITNETLQESLLGDTIGTSSGSGIIFDITTEFIYILTNNHVIDNSTNLSVNFFGSKMYASNVIGADPDTDLAVITVANEDLSDYDFEKIQMVKLGDSDLIEVGEKAIAIGNPLGYNNTVTVGVISAVDRIISRDLNALSLIQTDAAINPGNSGGALVNANGELIGINTVKISDTAVEGIGFAIPINSAIPILKDLISKGYVSKPFLGIYGRDITDDLAEFYEIPSGVFVSDIIQNSPASRSDLKAYDIITHIEAHEVLTMLELTQLIAGYNIGDAVELTVLRETEDDFIEMKIKVKLGDRHNF